MMSIRAFALVLCAVSMPSWALEPLSVQGNQVLAGGVPASFAGNSLFWSNNGWGGEKYYTADVVAWLKTDWKSSIVRAAMGVEEPGGFIQDPAGNKAKVKAVVEAAIANDMYVIIDFHSHKAEQYQSQAIAFFKEMAQTYGSYPHVIYEVYNEPISQSWSGQIKPYAQAVVNAIRAVDPDNLIVVGTRQWSQRVDEAANDPIVGNNIAYTLHFYAGTHFDDVRAWAQAALNKNAALFVTEWGTVNADGNGAVNHGNTDAWMAFLKDNKISHANWSINDKSEGASALLPGASSQGGWASLTESGVKVRDIVRNWQTGAPDVPPLPCNTLALPGRLQAEDFCAMQGVKTESTSDAGGGKNVGWLDAGDWMSYRLSVPEAGEYEITYRLASLQSGASFQLQKANGAALHQTAAPNTGGWQAWTSVTERVTLAAGVQDVRLWVVQGPFNINWLDFKKVATPAPTDSDGDGVPDSLDQCPGTAPGTAVDEYGCPLSTPTPSCEAVPEYPDWTRKDWPGGEPNHQEAGDEMQYQGKLYRANWYTTSVPGSDASWQFVKNC